jgi:hypothetical protein
MDDLRGQAVVVRTFGEFPVVRRLWGIEDGLALVVEDQWFQAVSAGDLTWAVAVPLSDVFRYDPRVLMEPGKPYYGWDALARLPV